MVDKAARIKHRCADRLCGMILWIIRCSMKVFSCIFSVSLLDVLNVTGGQISGVNWMRSWYCRLMCCVIHVSNSVPSIIMLLDLVSVPMYCCASMFARSFWSVQETRVVEVYVNCIAVRSVRSSYVQLT